MKTVTFNPLTHKVVPVSSSPEMGRAMGAFIDRPRHSSARLEQDCKVIDLAIAAAPAYPANAGWISVDDRLPSEDDGTVAVRLNDGSILTAWATYWHGASRSFSGWNHPFNIDDSVVTHWAMLPPVPEAV